MKISITNNFGQLGVIRTLDLLAPNQSFYQAELLTDYENLGRSDRIRTCVRVFALLLLPKQVGNQLPITLRTYYQYYYTFGRSDKTRTCMKV